MMIPVQHKKRIRLKGFDYSGRFRYFLTFCTKDKAGYFDDAALVSGVSDLLHEMAEKHGFKIWSFCFMPDHLHVLAEGEKQTSDLKKFASLFKQKTGYWFRQMQKKNRKVGLDFCRARIQPCENQGKAATLKGCPTKEENNVKDLWQVNYYEHVLRSDEATEKVARYILENPVRKGLATDFRDYPFSWCVVFDFAGQGFSLAERGFNVQRDGNEAAATLKGCPTKVKMNDSGFTLIEMVITIVLVSILSGLAAVIILPGVRAYSDEQSRSDVHYQARLATERIAREVRLTRSCAAITPTVNPATTLTFTDINNSVIAFSRTGNDLLRNGAVLAQNVTAFQVRYLDVNGTATASPGPTCGALPADTWLVEISLTVTDPRTAQSLDMLTRVYPRNF